MVRFGVILMVICVAASLVLAVTYKVTRPLIDAQEKAERTEALKDVLENVQRFEERMLGETSYFEAYDQNNNRVGYVLSAKAKGYGGQIDMLVGITDDGTVQGVRILSHSETPGLGSQINDIKYKEKKPWFTRQFQKKRLDELDFSRIQAITGATISSKAVLEGVKESVSDFLARTR